MTVTSNFRIFRCFQHRPKLVPDLVRLFGFHLNNPKRKSTPGDGRWATLFGRWRASIRRFASGVFSLRETASARLAPVTAASFVALNVAAPGLGVAQQPVTLQAEGAAWGAEVRVNQLETSRFPEVAIYATVTTPNGAPISGLDAQHFRLREGEVDLQLLAVEPQRDPLSAVLLIDISGSMKDSLDEAQEAAAGFLKLLSPGDQVQVMTFHEVIDTVYPLGSDFDAAERAIHDTSVAGDTALYDGTHAALSALQAVPGRRAVIVLSDGVDDDGSGKQLSKHDLGDPITKALVSNIPVYTIGLGENIDEGVLRTLGMTSGAAYLSAPTADDLDALYARLGQQLAGQYALRFISQARPNGSIQHVKLDLVIPGAKPFASPQEIVARNGQVTGYRTPDLDRDNLVHLAYLAGLTEMAERHRLTGLGDLLPPPQARPLWPAWLPVYPGAGKTRPTAERFNGVESVEFDSNDGVARVSQTYQQLLRDANWTITAETVIGDIATIEASRAEDSVKIAALADGPHTRVTAVLQGSASGDPIVISEVGATRSIDAQGRDVIISGAGCRVTITGQCRELSVTGARNQIQGAGVSHLMISGAGNGIFTGALREATLTGIDNRITWDNGVNGASPAVSDTGSRNSVTRR